MKRKKQESLPEIDSCLIFAKKFKQGALAHLARARHWQCRGDRFESGMLHYPLLFYSNNTGRNIMLRPCLILQQMMLCKVFP